MLQPQYDEVFAALSNDLGRENVGRLMAEGAAMTEDEAVEAAMEF